MSKHKWIEKYYEISKKTPEYKREFSNNANENGYNAKVKKGQEDDADRYCKDKVVTLLRYLFYNRSMYPFSDSLQIFKPRGTMFADRRIDIGDYAMTDMLVDKTLSEKRNYEKDDTIKYIRAKYALFEAINSLFETDENYVKNDILRFYKGYFFLKESSDTFELNLEMKNIQEFMST